VDGDEECVIVGVVLELGEWVSDSVLDGKWLWVYVTVRLAVRLRVMVRIVEGVRLSDGVAELLSAEVKVLVEVACSDTVLLRVAVTDLEFVRLLLSLLVTVRVREPVHETVELGEDVLIRDADAESVGVVDADSVPLGDRERVDDDSMDEVPVRDTGWELLLVPDFDWETDRVDDPCREKESVVVEVKVTDSEFVKVVESVSDALPLPLSEAVLDPSAVRVPLRVTEEDSDIDALRQFDGEGDSLVETVRFLDWDFEISELNEIVLDNESLRDREGVFDGECVLVSE